METPNFIKNKEVAPKVEILSFEEFMDEVYKGESLPQDNRFLSVEDGGVFKYFEPTNLTNSDFKNRINRTFPIVRVNNEIVALSELEKDPQKDNNFWIKFICVDPKYQNSGYATNLVEKIFQFAKKNNYSLKTSIYSEEGLEKLRKIIHRFEEQTGVTVVDRNNKN